MGSCGSSVMTQFVLTPSGSRRHRAADRPHPGSMGSGRRLVARRRSAKPPGASQKSLRDCLRRALYCKASSPQGEALRGNRAARVLKLSASPTPPGDAAELLRRVAGCTVRLHRRRPNGYLAQRVPSLLFASRERTWLNYAVLTCMFPWRARYPLSRCRL